MIITLISLMRRAMTRAMNITLVTMVVTTYFFASIMVVMLGLMHMVVATIVVMVAHNHVDYRVSTYRHHNTSLLWASTLS